MMLKRQPIPIPGCIKMTIIAIINKGVKHDYIQCLLWPLAYTRTLGIGPGRAAPAPTAARIIKRARMGQGWLIYARP